MGMAQENFTMTDELTEENFGSASLERYSDAIHKIWGNQITTRPVLATWLHVVEHASSACEGLRKRQWDSVLGELASVFVWWLAFIKKLNLLANAEGSDLAYSIPFTPSEIIWTKFPDVCPVEFGLLVQKDKPIGSDALLKSWRSLKGQRCACLARKREVEGRTKEEKKFAKRHLWEIARQTASARPSSLDEWEKLFRNLYEGSSYTLQIEEIGFHFMEEVGEVSEALVNIMESGVLATAGTKPTEAEVVEERLVRMKGLVEELADVFSWSMMLVHAIKVQIASLDQYVQQDPRTRDNALAKQLRNIIGDSAERVNFAEVLRRNYNKNGRFCCSACNNSTECSCGRSTTILLQAKFGEELRLQLQKALKEIKE